MTAVADRTPVAACKSCGEPIIWCRTEFGNRMPVDAEPNPNGNLVITPGARPTVAVHSGQTAAAAELDMKLYVSHFSSCRQRIEAARRAREARRPPAEQPDLFTTEPQPAAGD